MLVILSDVAFETEQLRTLSAIPQESCGEIAISYGDIIAVPDGNVIIFTCGVIVAVTFCPCVGCAQPDRRRMLYAGFAGRHVRKVQLPATNRRRDRRNPEQRQASR